MLARAVVSAADDLILTHPAQDLPRRCGPCMACCTALRVESLHKPAGVRCPHARHGCAIHSTKPEECRTFACAWLLGLGGDGDRPDRSGVLLDLVWQGQRAVTLRVISDGPAAMRLCGEAIERLALGGVEVTVTLSPT